jgi:tripartite-type tricarboxylate transporter receptor subunit TctC
LGNGSGSHLTAVLFKSMAGVEMVHVPYKGFGPLAPDLLTGRVHMLFNTIPSVLPHVRSGKLRALAITQDTRSRLLPEVPTAAESGLPQFNVTTWHGVFSTAGTPRPVIEKVNAALVKVVKSREMQERLQNEGAEPVGSSPETFAQFFQSERIRWARVIKDAKVTVD